MPSKVQKTTSSQTPSSIHIITIQEWKRVAKALVIHYNKINKVGN